MKKPITIIPTYILRRKFKDIKTKILLIEIYAEANFSRTIVNGLEILPGQAKTTLSQLVERTGLSRKEVRNRLDYLCQLGYISKDSNHHYLILTLNGYAELVLQREKDRAQDGARITNSNSEHYAINQTCEGTKGGTQKEHKKNNINNVVAPTVGILLEERQKMLKENVIEFLKSRGLYEAMQDEPSLKTAVNNFLSYYSVVDDTGLMKCEAMRNFRVDFHLLKWLRNENSIKNIIKI